MSESPTRQRRELLLRRLRPREVDVPFAAAGPAADGEPQPLSAPQQRLWFAEQIAAGGARYNVALAMRLTGVLDVPALERALGTVLARHGALRTYFPLRDEEPVQIVRPELALPLAAQPLPPGAEEDELLAAAARQPFDIERGPLVRARLWRIDERAHVLLLSMHHLITDGWSTGIVQRELTECYRAEVTGESPALARDPAQYADYACWQPKWLTGTRLDRQLQYWTRNLADAPAVLDLATDRPRSGPVGGVASEIPFDVDPEVIAALERLAAAEGGTLNMVLLAAYLLLLGNYGGSSDVVVGTPMANRGRPELYDVVGFFVNMVAIRARLAPAQGFRALLREVKQTTLDAIAHQELPFEKLVETLRPDRAAHHPIFQAVFSFAQSDEAPIDLPGLTVTSVPLPAELAKFDLVLSMRRTGSALAGAMSYDTALFEHARIDRLTSTFRELLRVLAAEPDRPLAELAVRCTQDRLLLDAMNDTATATVPRPIVADLVERLGADPARTALLWPDGRLDRAAFDSWTRRAAHRLRSSGVTAEDVVVVFAPRSPELVVGLAAALRAGAAFLALDPEHGDARIDRILANAAPAAILTLPRWRERFDAPVIDLTDLGVGEFTDAGAEPAQLAYAVFTSGSTGMPKGALNTHLGLANRLGWMREYFGIGQDDVVLQKTPTSFDVSVWELLLPLYCGATQVLAGPGEHRDPRRIAELVAQHGVTTIHFVPTMLRAFLDVPELASQVGSLRRVICSGESLHGDLRERFFALLPGVELYNLYGPAEAAIDVTAWRCEPGSERPTVPIGAPIANTTTRVYNSELRAVPVGVPGELYLGGANVGRGYLGDPARTAEKFLPDPDARTPGARMYRTGDLARVTPTGELEFLGRVDRQLKLGGVRIEPGEIEAVLAEHELVAEAVVLPDEQSAEPRLLAYLVPDRASAARDAEGRHELPNGLMVRYHNAAETDFVYQEIFTGDGYLQHGVALRDGDCVFDVGANIGMFALFVGLNYPHATVYAFEPIPATARLLRANLTEHQVLGSAFDCALADHEGTATFTYYPHLSIISGRHTGAEDREVVRGFAVNALGANATEADLDSYLDELLTDRLAPEQLTCRLRTMSEVIREHGISTIDLLKIDVEKSEREVLDGIEPQDWPKIRQVVVEVHDLDGRLAQITGLLRGHGFQCFAEEQSELGGTGLFTLFAHRDSRGDAAKPLARPVPGNRLGPAAFVRTVREFAAEKLPSVMVPSEFVTIAELPLSPNGKVDRGALPRPKPSAATRYVEPRNLLERTLAEIWSEVLGCGPVGVHDNFFELGGHSLLGVRLLAAIRYRIGLNLPLPSLFDNPTVAAQAQLSGELDALPERPLIPLHRAGTQPALFCVHPMGGSVFSYSALANGFGADQPFYGIQARGLDAGEQSTDDLVAMAADYVAALRATHRGPWRLLGYSFGGVVAFEMACQLQAAGEQVELLSIVDALPTRPGEAADTSEPGVIASFLAYHGGITGADLIIDKADLAAMSPHERRQAAMAKVTEANMLTAESGDQYFGRLLEVFMNNWRAYVHYRPGVFSGRTLVLKTGGPAEQHDARQSWARLCDGPLDVVWLPGEHNDILRAPNVGLVVDTVRAALARIA